MKYKGVIFDLDGTLLNTLDDIAYCGNKVLVEHGFNPYPTEDYKYFVGDGIKNFIKRMLPVKNLSDIEIEHFVKSFKKYYSQNWNVKTRPYDGVNELLKKLNELGVKISILSNKPDDFVKMCVAELLHDFKFEIVIGEKEGFPPKPDPFLALEIARHLKIDPNKFLYVGDSGVDMKTALNASMFPVGVLWGFRSKEELLENGGKALIKKPLELLKLL